MVLAAGPSQIAERVLQALEAADASVGGLPRKVAGALLVALRSSGAEQEELARQIARLFPEDLLAAAEATVNRALLDLGECPDR